MKVAPCWEGLSWAVPLGSWGVEEGERSRPAQGACPPGPSLLHTPLLFPPSLPWFLGAPSFALVSSSARTSPVPRQQSQPSLSPGPS